MRALMLTSILLVPACGMIDRIMPGRAAEDPPSAAQRPDATTPRPQSRPDIGAVAPVVPQGGGVLGTTVAGLGDVTQGGLWLRTPLVAAERSGVVFYGGQSVAVTLLPLPGPSGAGSQLSLNAMRSLGAPLTELVEVRVEAL